MVNVLIAPDKFKGSLSAREVCDAIEEGLKKMNCHVTSIPLADGGEGTCELLTNLSQGSKIELTVQGPLFDSLKADYGISKDGTTAFIEMARASGLQLLVPEKRNPMRTTTYGTGELIRDALDRGVQKIILGIGGSATNDAGIGMAAALGFGFFHSSGSVLMPTGENLLHLHTIKPDNKHERLEKTSFITLCDVSNPLFGPQGAAFVYGPQKGADSKAVTLLDTGLRNFSEVVQKTFGIIADFPGAGAAGGLGAGTKIFLSASIKKGMDYIIETTDLKEKVKKADLVITGEGKLDQQTLSGKVIMEVSRIAAHFGKPVAVICGKSELASEDAKRLGISQVISLINDSTSSEQAMDNAFALIKKRISENLVI